MQIVAQQQIAQHASGTRSVEKFGRLIGEKPHKLGQMASLYPDLTVDNIINSLNNIYTDSARSTKYTRILNTAIEWDIAVKYIKKVYFGNVQPVSNANETSNRKRFKVRFKERYFDKNDVILLQNKQKLFIREEALPMSTGDFEYTCTLIADSENPNTRLNLAYIRPNRYARYIYNSFPEISERGFTKRHSERETHRNYMTRIRHSVDWTMDYAQREKVYIQDGKGDKTKYYEMQPAEKECIDMYKLSREYYNLYGESNYDKFGKCLDFDDKGQELPMGDGIIRQVERYANRYSFNDLDVDVLDDMIYDMVKRCDMPEGNTFTLICNERFKRLFGTAIKEDLRYQGGNNGAYYYSMAAGQKVKVGANFISYSVQGNEIVIATNRILSEEYPDQAFAICLNPKQHSNGEPTMASFVYGEAELIEGYLDGMGGQDGKTSGKVMTATTVSSFHLLGTAGVVYFNPYMAFMLKENVRV